MRDVPTEDLSMVFQGPGIRTGWLEERRTDIRYSSIQTYKQNDKQTLACRQNRTDR